MSRPTILYVHDPLCGWCYGFAPVVHALRTEFAGRVDFDLIHGGMITAGRIGPVRAMADYIRSATPRLVDLTGAQITDAFLQDYLSSDAISDSEPPSRAIVAAGQLGGDTLIWNYAYALQRCLFVQGMDLRSTDTYRDLARQFDLDSEMFLETMRSEAVRELTHEQFGISRQLGITGFPALILLQNETAYRFASGYQPLAHLRPALEQVIQQPPSSERWP